ncbi:hypothetical protein [Variovorax atrisoli]|uniref:hypothetical protein n=1 Tax=Variovorax atrisoli TaxID=3394203 RepID=UPI0012FD729C|nr:hypothetical protein [Variovorax paradoxus]
MRANAIFILAVLAAGGVHAQDCARATRNYEVSINSMRPDAGMVDRAVREMQAACGYGPAAPLPPRAQYQPEPEPNPVRRPPGQFVNCDQAGCWGSANGVRYNFVAGGNLQGTNGSFCARGAGNTFHCN